MTTEQMDWLDDERAGRHKVPTTADVRQAAAEQGPVILYGTPTAAELIDARARAGVRGVLVVPAELDPRTTTEKEADDNAVQARIERRGLNIVGYGDPEVAPERSDAITTRGSRIPDTLASYAGTPIAAYNLGWQEGRESVTNPGLVVSADGETLNWQGEHYVRQTADWGPIPRYAMLDIWMAIYGSDTSQEFEAFADENGYADTWARLCYVVREAWNRLDDVLVSSETSPEIPDGEHLRAQGAVDATEAETTMAEEPIEDRLRRAWMNGYVGGFREGMERGAYYAGGEWDQR